MSEKISSSKTRILIADDHAVLRSGLRMLINAQADMSVVGEAANCEEAVKKASELTPDLMLLDITMGDDSSISIIPQIRKNSKQTRILILTMHEDPAYLGAVLQAGASGYVVKKAADNELLAAIRAVNEGRTFVDMGMSKGTTDTIVRRHADAKTDQTEEVLSPREQEVLLMVAQGHTNQQVADQLKISVKSVESYRSRLMEKLKLRSRADLVRFALESGLLKG